MFRFLISSLTFLGGTISACCAHDLWIEAQNSVVVPGETVRIDFKLGNCNEGRRDFLTNGLIDPSGVLTRAQWPSKRPIHLIDKFSRSAKDKSEGFWSSNLLIPEKGTVWIQQSLDQLIEHDGVKMQGIVTAKAFVIGSDSLDRPSDEVVNPFLEMPFELVLESSPLPSLANGDSIQVRLMLDSRPLESVIVSFLPQGIDSETEDDKAFEHVTDAEGVAEHKPDRMGLYLISARTVQANRKVIGPKEVYYSTSLTIRVSNRKLGTASSAVITKAAMNAEK